MLLATRAVNMGRTPYFARNLLHRKFLSPFVLLHHKYATASPQMNVFATILLMEISQTFVFAL